MIGPLLMAGALTAAGLHWSAVPGWLAVCGQIAIGTTLGTRFTPSFYRSAPRVVLASAAVTVVAMLACGLFACSPWRARRRAGDAGPRDVAGRTWRK